MQQRRDAVADDVVLVPAPPPIQAKPAPVKLKIARPPAASARAVHFPGEPAQAAEKPFTPPVVASASTESAAPPKVKLKFGRPAAGGGPAPAISAPTTSAKRSRPEPPMPDVDADLEGEMDLMDAQHTRAPSTSAADMPLKKKPKLVLKKGGASANAPQGLTVKTESSTTPAPQAPPAAVQPVAPPVNVSAADPGQWDAVLDESIPFYKLRANEMIDILWKDPSALFFLQPVQDRDAPNYSKEIAYPMDVGTIRKKINEKSYQNMAAFYRDLKAIIDK